MHNLIANSGNSGFREKSICNKSNTNNSYINNDYCVVNDSQNAIKITKSKGYCSCCGNKYNIYTCNSWTVLVRVLTLSAIYWILVLNITNCWQVLKVLKSIATNLPDNNYSWL